MFKIVICLLVMTLGLNLWALEIDDKLTMRIVKVSQSRKTILVNRGIEDGLVKGDHAKFFLTVGVVARGVAVKLSPTRSVWSIYRLVNAEYIKDGQVMQLKITPAVKITEDNSKSLVSDDTPSSTVGSDPRSLGIPLAEGADDIAEMSQQMGDSAQMNQSGMNVEVLQATSLLDKAKEIFGSIHYSGLTSITTPSDGSSEYKGENSALILNVGGEFYSKNESQWHSRFSLIGQYTMSRISVMGHEGSMVSESSSEFGGGIHWYPLTRPSRTYNFIPYGRLLFLMGSTNTSFTPGISGGSAESLAGATVAYAIGGGMKYYIHNGIGVRAEFEYYTRGDSFAADQNGTKWSRTSSGPRLLLGVSKRW